MTRKSLPSYVLIAIGLAVASVTIDRLWIRSVNHDVLSRRVNALHETLKHDRHALEALRSESRRLEARVEALVVASDSLGRLLDVHRRDVIEREAVLSHFTQPEVPHVYPDSALLSELHRLLRDARTRSGAH